MYKVLAQVTCTLGARSLESQRAREVEELGRRRADGQSCRRDQAAAFTPPRGRPGVVGDGAADRSACHHQASARRRPHHGGGARRGRAREPSGDRAEPRGAQAGGAGTYGTRSDRWAESLVHITASGNRLFDSAAASRNAWLANAIEQNVPAGERAALERAIALLERLAAAGHPGSWAAE